MKKILSILLSVALVAGLFVALIPAANAAEGGYEAPTPIPEVTKGELIYEETFDTVDFSLTDDALADALGWTDRTVSMAIMEDSNVVSVVDEDIYGHLSDWQVPGNHRLVVSGGRAYGGPTIVVDDRLAGGDYIFEYTAVMINNTASDGQGLGFCSGGFPTNKTSPSTDASFSVIWRTLAKERGQFDAFLYVNGTHKSFLSFGDYEPSTKACVKDFLLNSMVTGRGSICNQEIRYRIIVDADFGFSIWIYDNEISDWVVWASMKGVVEDVETFQKLAPYIANSIMMRLQPNVTVLVDDIQVWTIDKTNYVMSELANADLVDYSNEDGSELSDNALLITAINNEALPSNSDYDFLIGNPKDGTVELNEDGSYKYGQDGINDLLRFEYVEVYNASNVTKNIYDYAFGINNAVEKTWLTYPTSRGKTNPILPGKHTATSTNNTWGYTYVNPEYADGAIAPGESAIIMIPNCWWMANQTNGTNESFRRIYLEQILGMSREEADAVKVFTYAPDGGAGINNSGTALLTLVPLVDGAVPTAYAEGWALDYTYLESYLLAATNTGNSNTLVAFNPAANGDGSIIAEGYKITKFYAANYDHWTDDGEYIPAGILSANSLTLETTTPGTVPDELKRPGTIPQLNATVTVESDESNVVLGQEMTFRVSVTGADPVKALGLIPVFDTAFFEVIDAKWEIPSDMQSIETGTLRSAAAWSDLTDINTVVYTVTLRAKELVDATAVDFEVILQDDTGTYSVDATAKTVSIIYCPHANGTSVSLNAERHQFTCDLCGHSVDVEHRYDGRCDSSCNDCGFERVAPHSPSARWYSDANGHWHECTACGALVDAYDHEYSDDCDSSCNDCGFERVAPHSPSAGWCSDANGHWHECTACGAAVDAHDHEYSGDYDSHCNVCDYQRFLSGDVDNDGNVDSDDAIYLLYSVMYGAGDYPTYQPTDFNSDGVTNSDDAVLLLYHALYGAADYPLRSE